MPTNSSVDLPLGLNVLGPPSKRILAVFPWSSFTVTRSLLTHPPKRGPFSRSVIRAEGNRLDKWKAEESPVSPPPKTEMWVGGGMTASIRVRDFQ